LLVLKLFDDGHFEEIYNGSGHPAWEASGKMQKNGQRPISLFRLRGLAEKVPQIDRLARRPQTKGQG
jgi:hypothetical protein